MTTTRGLATIALLKVNFDSGRDYLAMFEPFVIDGIMQFQPGTFTVTELRERVAERHQLSLPEGTLRTLIGRAVTRGYAIRAAGRYRTATVPDVPDLLVRRAEVESAQKELAESLIEFASRQGYEIASAEEALNNILAFMNEYQMPLILEGIGTIIGSAPVRSIEDEGPRNALEVVTARFLRDIVSTNGRLVDVLQQMLEGFVLQNTLLLKDITTATRSFAGLRVFVDSLVLFAALGRRGEALRIATCEQIELLRSVGATIEVFGATVEEMRRMLRGYARSVATPRERATLRPSDLTHHYIRKSPSDIKADEATLSLDLKRLGLQIRSMPRHEVPYTLDERDLAKRLSSAPGDETSPRVVHDVDCTAAVLTLRRGRRSDSIDYAGCIFVTSNQLVYQTVAEWYRAQEPGGSVPPIAHYLMLSNLAWLKRPASASRLKLHELVALCTAALRPSRKAWSAFQGELRRLRDSGRIASDEEVAVIVTSFVETPVTPQLGDDDVDAETIDEVIERIREQYETESSAALRDVQASAESRGAKLQVADQRVKAVATIISWVPAGIWAGCAVVGAAASSVYGIEGIVPPLWVWFGLLLPGTLGGLLGLCTGFTLKSCHDRMVERLVRRLRLWLTGNPEADTLGDR